MAKRSLMNRVQKSVLNRTFKVLTIAAGVLGTGCDATDKYGPLPCEPVPEGCAQGDCCPEEDVAKCPSSDAGK